MYRDIRGARVMAATHPRGLDAVLVTNNPADFYACSHLTIENWVDPRADG